MALPTFIVFGSRKAGTTSLYKFLDEHPEIYMSELKGTRFFSFDPERPELGEKLPVKTLADYESYFTGGARPEIKAIGEVTPSYITGSSTAARIQQTLPRVKLIASLRNPIDRAYSQYQMDMRNLRPEDREELTIRNVDRWVPAGRYAQLLEPYYDLFEKHQLHLMVFENWIRKPESMLTGLYDFIGVDSSFSPDLSRTFNKGGIPKNQILADMLKHRPAHRTLKKYVPVRMRVLLNSLRSSNMQKAPPLNSEVRSYLLEQYRAENERLATLTGLDLQNWAE